MTQEFNSGREIAKSLLIVAEELAGSNDASPFARMCINRLEYKQKVNDYDDADAGQMAEFKEYLEQHSK